MSEGLDSSKEGDTPLSVLSISDGITDNILKEDLQNTSSLFINET